METIEKVKTVKMPKTAASFVVLNKSNRFKNIALFPTEAVGVSAAFATNSWSMVTLPVATTGVNEPISVDPAALQPHGMTQVIPTHTEEQQDNDLRITKLKFWRDVIPRECTGQRVYLDVKILSAIAKLLNSGGNSRGGRRQVVELTLNKDPNKAFYVRALDASLHATQGLGMMMPVFSSEMEVGHITRDDFFRGIVDAV